MDTDAHISLQIHVLIECKHREGLAVFGFPHRPKAWRKPMYPIVSEFSFASWMQEIGRKVPFFTDDPVCTIGLLDNMHKSPRVSDEQLIYKAAASLYDCIHFQTMPLVEPYLDETIEAMDMLKTIEENTSEWLDWWEATRQWVRTQGTQDMYQAFQAAFEATSSHLVQPITVFVPVVCVDARLYNVELDVSGEIAEITPAPYVLSTLRVPRWPSRFQHYLVQPDVEALVTVVDVEHLGSFLDRLADWFHAIGQALMGVEEDAITRALFEKAVLQSVASKQPAPRRSAGLWNV